MGFSPISIVLWEVDLYWITILNVNEVSQALSYVRPSDFGLRWVQVIRSINRNKIYSTKLVYILILVCNLTLKVRP